MNGKGCVCKDQDGDISEDFPIYYGYCCENGELTSFFMILYKNTTLMTFPQHFGSCYVGVRIHYGIDIDFRSLKLS